MKKSFTDTVRAIVRTIPKGTVLTYKQVAEKAGNIRASRAVANIMAKNYDLDIPCHRVIRSDGGLGGYNRGGIVKKRKILLAEGVELKDMIQSRTLERLDKAKSLLTLYDNNVELLRGKIDRFTSEIKQLEAFMHDDNREFDDAVKNNEQAQKKLNEAKDTFEKAQRAFEATDKAVRNKKSNPTTLQNKTKLERIKTEIVSVKRELITHETKMAQEARNVIQLERQLADETAEQLRRARVSDTERRTGSRNEVRRADTRNPETSRRGRLAA